MDGQGGHEAKSGLRSAMAGEPRYAVRARHVPRIIAALSGRYGKPRLLDGSMNAFMLPDGRAIDVGEEDHHDAAADALRAARIRTVGDAMTDLGSIHFIRLRTEGEEFNIDLIREPNEAQIRALARFAKESGYGINYDIQTWRPELGYYSPIEAGLDATFSEFKRALDRVFDPRLDRPGVLTPPSPRSSSASRP